MQQINIELLYVYIPITSLSCLHFQATIRSFLVICFGNSPISYLLDGISDSDNEPVILQQITRCSPYEVPQILVVFGCLPLGDNLVYSSFNSWIKRNVKSGLTLSDRFFVSHLFNIFYKKRAHHFTDVPSLPDN